jgi:hypothetical protein
LNTIVLQKEKEAKHLTKFELSVSMILMKVIGDSFAIRHLVLQGFDTSAKTLLRSTAEYMELLVAVIDQPSLAKEFARTHTPFEANQFWKAHLAAGRIRKKIFAAWQGFFGDDPESCDAARWFAHWGNNSNDVLSAMIHRSFAAGAFTAIPFKSKYTEEKWLGFLGDKSDGSADTIYIYCAFMFPILVLNCDFPFKNWGDHLSKRIKYRDADEFHRHVRHGRSVLASLILSLGKDTNVPHVFPNIDVSIWAE